MQVLVVCWGVCLHLTGKKRSRSRSIPRSARSESIEVLFDPLRSEFNESPTIHDCGQTAALEQATLSTAQLCERDSVRLSVLTPTHWIATDCTSEAPVSTSYHWFISRLDYDGALSRATSSSWPLQSLTQKRNSGRVNHGVVGA